MSRSRLSRWLPLAAIACCHAARAQTPIPPSPWDFAADAAQSDNYEIQAANLAVVQGQDARVRTFAQQMLRDHKVLGERLRDAVAASALPPLYPGMSSDQSSLLSSLQSVRGHEFDKRYAIQQELAHVQALVVEESFATAGSDPNLRKAAQSALPMIKDHLTMARQLRSEVGG